MSSRAWDGHTASGRVVAFGLRSAVSREAAARQRVAFVACRGRSFEDPAVRAEITVRRGYWLPLVGRIAWGETEIPDWVGGYLSQVLAVASIAGAVWLFLSFPASVVVAAVLVLGFAVRSRSRRRVCQMLHSALEEGVCPDCGHPAGRGSELGPEHCPACGCLWPLVPAEAPVVPGRRV